MLEKLTKASESGKSEHDFIGLTFLEFALTSRYDEEIEAVS